MKHLAAILLLIVSSPKISFSQEVKKPGFIKYIFDPNADAKRDVDMAVEAAKVSHKKVLVLVGGDWNYWSRVAYADLVDSLHCRNKVELALVNFSTANKNTEVLTALGCPKDQGYPIFIVLDEKGKKVFAEETASYKANAKSYNLPLLSAFINQLSLSSR